MPHLKVLIHAVWGTKNRFPFLTDVVRPIVIDHIEQNAVTKGIKIDAINGYVDHLHCLFWLKADVTIAKVLQLLKGESAFWINKNNITDRRFEWADEYYAASVSESVANNVRVYIRNQETHHKEVTFDSEFAAFVLRHDSKDGG